MKSNLLVALLILLLQYSNAQNLVNNTKLGSFNVQIRYFTSVENQRPQIKCLGSLITLKHVLTAASCVNLPANQYFVNVGSTAFMGIGDDSVTNTVAEVMIHPGFEEEKVL
jgi:hypothetical protein